jgi:hypothetical protein
MAMLRSSHGMSAWGHSRPCRDDRYGAKRTTESLTFRRLEIDRVTSLNCR